MTVYGLIANTCCRDPRVTAAISMAGVYRAFPHGRYVHRAVPVLLVQGDADKGYHNSVTAYPQLAAPKWFVTLHGSLHSPPFEVPRGSEAPVVDSVTTAFWSTYLSAQPSDARDHAGRPRRGRSRVPRAPRLTSAAFQRSPTRLTTWFGSGASRRWRWWSRRSPWRS